jgi:alpha-tubulin suppressor-like RCC1 family protein
VKALSAGGWHSLALLDDGSLYGWGWNEGGQLGLGPAMSGGADGEADQTDQADCMAGPSLRPHSLVPAQLPAPAAASADTGRLGEAAAAVEATVWSSISAGGWHSAATTSDGRLFTWGSNDLGHLGHGQAHSQNPPLGIIPQPLAFLRQEAGKTSEGGAVWIESVTAGSAHTLARGRDVVSGDVVVFACGAGGHGRLGTGSVANQWLVKQVAIPAALALTTVD